MSLNDALLFSLHYLKVSLKILLAGSYLDSNLEGMLFSAFRDLGYNIDFFSFSKYVPYSSIIRYFISRSKAIKHVSDISVLSKVNSIFEKHIADSKPDLLLVIKGEFLTPTALERIKAISNPKIALWYPDDPRYFNTLVEDYADKYDIVFTSSSKTIDRYRKAGFGNVAYLPFGCFPSIHRRLNLPKQVDVSFIGSWYPRRGKIIREIKKSNICTIDYYGPFWNLITLSKSHSSLWGIKAVEQINSSRIALNIHEESDIDFKPNMRTFEIPACGTLMMSDRVHMIDSFFTPGREIVVFDSTKELTELIRYYLDNEEEREEIAARGHIRAHREHSYQNRAKTIAQECRINF